MNKSANVSTTSPDSLNGLIWFLLIAALIAYTLPWVVNPGVSLTLGAYDLAEWTSLSRDVDMMSTVLALRLPPVFLVWIAAIVFGYPRFTRAWWLTALFTLLITIALLPPIEFLQDTGNTNYRQQLMVAGLAFLGGMIGLSGLLYRLRTAVVIAVCGIALLVGIAGLTQAFNFMRNLNLPVNVGAGGIIFGVVIVVFIAIYSLAAYRRINRRWRTT